MKTKYKLGLLMLSASCTLMANGIKEDYSLNNSDIHHELTESTDSNYEYPKLEVLLSVYKELIRQDAIHVGEGVLSMIDPFEEVILDEDILKTVYDWAIDNEFISLTDGTFIAQDIKEDDFDYFNPQKRYWGCLNAVMGCGLEVVGAVRLKTGLACVAAAAEEGLNPWADDWCATQMAALGLGAAQTCGATLWTVCRGSRDTSGLKIGPVGGSDGRQRYGTCSENGRVHKLKVWTRNSLVTKVTAYCNDGSDFTVGTGSGNIGTASCSDNGLASGLNGRSGSHVDRIGISCDTVTQSGKYYTASNEIGGWGGSNFQLNCPAGEGYLYGLDVRESRDWLARHREFISIAAICK